MNRLGLLVTLVLLALPLCAQQAPGIPESSASPQPPVPGPREGVVRQIEFVGLRRISAEALRPRLSLREGQALDVRLIERDVRALDDLGWFESVTVRVELLPVQIALLRPVSLPISGGAGMDATGWPAAASRLSPSLLNEMAPSLRLIYVLEERPFLAGVDFFGSRLLDGEEITRLLSSHGLAPKLAWPSNRTELWRASRLIESELAERGRPQAQAKLRLVELPGEAVRAEFQIADGPRILAGLVDFVGNTAFSDRKLRRRMDRVAPHAFWAGLRGKDVFTPQRLELDRERIERYYRNHGYPHARLGEAQVEVFKKKIRSWFPWPRSKEEDRFHISIPVTEGLQYRLDSIRVEGPGLDDLGSPPEALAKFIPGEPYSEEKLLRARDELARLPQLNSDAGVRHAVEVDQRFDPAAGSVSVVFRARRIPEVGMYLVRRIEFSGHHRFSDRFYRRRVGLHEGEPFDERKLEEGLQRLARTGFIHAVTPEQVRFTWDHQKRTVDIHVTVEEIGRQRISLLGGAAGWGNTIGVAYNLFDLLGGEELITGHLEGGPDSLYAALNLAREGFLGTRASFGLALFHNVVRPRLPGSGGRERLFTSRSTGLSQRWSYPLSREESIGLRYDFAATHTRIPLPGSATPDLVSRTTSSLAGITWAHDKGAERLVASTSLAGGPLGGREQWTRSSVEFARLARDPLSHGRNAWAFRGLFSSVAAHSGANLPLHARLFGGGELVRGLRPGELTSYTGVITTDSSGLPVYRAQAAGANLVVAANAEYRMPVEPVVHNLEAAVFFDSAAGWLLPGLLGEGDSRALPAAQGRWQTFTGVELRWRLPETLLGAPNPLAGETLRVHYAADPLRLAHTFLLPDGSRFRAPARVNVVGWALGPLF